MADHKLKIKESEKRDNYWDLARKLKKKLWNMKVTVILFVIGAFGIIPKGLVKGSLGWEIIGQMQTIQTPALLRSARILGRILETWGDLLSLKLRWKNFQRSLIIKFIENTMGNWRVELTTGGKTGENPESDLPGRYAITITICYRDHATQSLT